MYFDESGCGNVGRRDVEGRFETDDEGMRMLDVICEPIDDLRVLVSGIPKRLCKRMRVDVGCFEVTADSDDDAGEGLEGGDVRGDWKGDEEG